MNFNTRTAMIVGIGACVVAAVGIIIVLFSGNSSVSGSAIAPKPAISSVAPLAVYQPPSAKQVADSLNCQRFEDHGASQIGGSIDSGACWIGNVKYAINTFPSKAVRDSWLQAAEPLGVVPKWETTTSVTYKSVD